MTDDKPTYPELDLDKEYGGNSGQPPVFLKVLIVLTSINVIYSLYQSLKDLFVGAESAASIEASVYQSMSDSGVDMSTVPDWVTSGLMEFVEKYSQNAVTLRITDIFYYVLLGTAAGLMYKLSLKGYYLYVIVNILGVLAVPFLFGFNFVSYTLMFMYSFVAVVFIALYSANKKHLY